MANLEAEKAKSAEQDTKIQAQKRQNSYLFIGLGIVALFGAFMYNRFRVTRKQKLEIGRQKTEIEKQKSVVEDQKHFLEEAHQTLAQTYQQLEESHKEITDSINYAERIQRSFLSTKEILDENLKDYFVLFRPKDVVSGDFYWSAKLNDGSFAWSVADSTGHGVPGAIMSLLNISSLEKSIETEVTPDKILIKTREIIIDRLKRDGSKDGGKDGMDGSLLVIDSKRENLSFSSANNSVLIVRGRELIEFKGDKMPVGKHELDHMPFTLHTITVQVGDVIYALTDGFQDQFGGTKGKKYMVKNLKQKLVEIAHMPMSEQEQLLNIEFNSWKQGTEQVDDVCILGVRI